MANKKNNKTRKPISKKEAKRREKSRKKLRKTLKYVDTKTQNRWRGWRDHEEPSEVKVYNLNEKKKEDDVE